MLDTQAMHDLMAAIRLDFDVVIIDAPPMLPVADASILATEVDGVLLLTRHGTTSREQLRQAVARLEAVGGRLFGTVLNRTPRKFLGTYGYGYEYGYGYGSTSGSAATDNRKKIPAHGVVNGTPAGTGRRVKR